MNKNVDLWVAMGISSRLYGSMHSDVRKIGTDGIKNVAILRLGHSVNVDLVFCMNLYSRKMLARKTM